MNRAIKGLFENPQNNLKTFQDGKMVYNEYSPDKHSLKRIMKSLFPDVKSVDKYVVINGLLSTFHDADKCHYSFVHYRQEVLMINLIRKILLKDFTCCDNEMDVCDDYEMAQNVHRRSCRGELFSQLPRNCILSSILKAQHLVGDNFSNMEFFEREGDNVIDGYERILQDYRMGSTALDCSVMVTLKRLNFDNDV
jgi:hypothetical protein